MTTPGERAGDREEDDAAFCARRCGLGVATFDLVFPVTAEEGTRERLASPLPLPTVAERREPFLSASNARARATMAASGWGIGWPLLLPMVLPLLVAAAISANAISRSARISKGALKYKAADVDLATADVETEEASRAEASHERSDAGGSAPPYAATKPRALLIALTEGSTSLLL